MLPVRKKTSPKNKKMKKKTLFALFTIIFLGIMLLLSRNSNIPIQAEAAVVLDGETGEILFDKNADRLLSPASMTKMLTEYIVLEAIDSGSLKWKDSVIISEYAHLISLDLELANVPLHKGETYTVKELFDAMAIYSANGAAIALAEKLAGSEKNFVELMNAKAEELDIGDFYFVNCTGLNNSDLAGLHQVDGQHAENRLTAHSTALLAYHLIKDYPSVIDIASIPKKTFREGTNDAIEMTNWNMMLPGLKYEYTGLDGLKTGTTSQAGYSFTATAQKDGKRLISVVMKAKSTEARFMEMKKLMDFGFSGSKDDTTLVSLNK